MQINCIICTDLILLTENIYFTKCGHVFHYHCLLQWMNRSQSCPQCRSKVTEECIKRVYFNFASRNSIDNYASNATALQLKLDNAGLELESKNANLKEKQKKIMTLEGLLKAERETLKGTQTKLADKETTIVALKEQLEYVKIENRETKRLRTENETLSKTLSGFKEALEKAKIQEEKSQSKLQASQTDEQESMENVISELENVTKKLKERIISKNVKKVKTVQLKRKLSEADIDIVIIDESPPAKIYKSNKTDAPSTSTESREIPKKNQNLQSLQIAGGSSRQLSANQENCQSIFNKLRKLMDEDGTKHGRFYNSDDFICPVCIHSD